MSVHDHECRTYRGEPFNLGALRGQVLLIVNVASKCRFTPQLAELETLYRTHRERGFTVLCFPCNQFACQSPESAEEFHSFSVSRHGVTFPLMEKVEVNGDNAHPLFRALKQGAPGVLGTQTIKWNFTKFLVGRDGRVICRFGPQDTALEMWLEMEQALDEPTT